MEKEKRVLNFPELETSAGVLKELKRVEYSHRTHMDNVMRPTNSNYHLQSNTINAAPEKRGHLHTALCDRSV